MSKSIKVNKVDSYLNPNLKGNPTVICLCQLIRIDRYMYVPSVVTITVFYGKSTNRLNLIIRGKQVER